MKRFGKFLVMFVLAGLITVGSFMAGMFFYANFFSSALAASAGSPFSLATGTPAGPPDQVPAEFAAFWEAWSFLNENYYGEIPADNERVYGAIRGMVASFGDQNTGFIDPVRAAVMSENISGSFEGIGAAIRLDEAGRLVIADPFPGHPAFKAGLRPDDIVLEVDGQPVENLSLYESVLLIRGPAGTEVILTVFREGELKPFDVAIVREKIEIEVVQAEMLEDNIGYIRLSQFTNGAAGKIIEEAETLRDQGATSFILDLRSNPGGLLSEAVAVSSLFIDQGTVVIEKLQDEEKLFDARHGIHFDTDIPLVVLVNGGSASASEIVAGAIQDVGRGTIIGEQTFGKGSVQIPHALSDGSELRVTIAEWLTPARRQIHGKGITPDIVVEMTLEDFEQEHDPQLEEAINFLQGESGVSVE
jgi:carboxyl-terminal processing protease